MFHPLRRLVCLVAHSSAWVSTAYTSDQEGLPLCPLVCKPVCPLTLSPHEAGAMTMQPSVPLQRPEHRKGQ